MVVLVFSNVREGLIAGSETGVGEQETKMMTTNKTTTRLFVFICTSIIEGIAIAAGLPAAQKPRAHPAVSLDHKHLILSVPLLR
jgi:hypothetical protein